MANVFLGFIIGAAVVLILHGIRYSKLTVHRYKRHRTRYADQRCTYEPTPYV